MTETILDFINEDIEKEILKLVPKVEKLDTAKRNQILRFGNDMYRKDLVSTVIPSVFEQFRDKIDFNSVQINEYYEGQGIDYHLDHPRAGECIYVVSMLTDSTIYFRKDALVEEYNLPRYSLFKFYGEHRWNYFHSVKADKLRYSLVFRKFQS